MTPPHDCQPAPVADLQTGLQSLKVMWRERSPLGVLALQHRLLGTVFRVNLPGFRPIVTAGHQLAREVMVSDRHSYAWRTPADPVAKLLRKGVLVTDSAEHLALREEMMPFLQRRAMLDHIPTMQRATQQVMNTWQSEQTVDMLVEMRKVALLILMDTLFAVDMWPDMRRLWPAVMGVLRYISPGAWVVAPKLPRFGFAKPLAQMDDYLYSIITERRAAKAQGDDMLSHLVHNTAWSDDVIRDQMLTMLIAGHDTSTALLAWSLFLLGKHTDWYEVIQQELAQTVDDKAISAETLPKLTKLDQFLKETLRLYPPIHVGNRRRLETGEVAGHCTAADERVMVSIYATQRDPDVWETPDSFDPERFCPHQKHKRPAFAYIPFGGGPRNCIGAAMGQIEAKVVLVHILQQYDLNLLNGNVHAHMGATLEPRPGVSMAVTRR